MHVEKIKIAHFLSHACANVERSYSGISLYTTPSLRKIMRLVRPSVCLHVYLFDWAPLRVNPTGQFAGLEALPIHVFACKARQNKLHVLNQTFGGKFTFTLEIHHSLIGRNKYNP